MNDSMSSRMRRLVDRVQVERSVSRMVILCLAAFALFTIINPRVFLNPLNLQNIMLASPEIGVLAVAMMVAMLTGGIDLSVVAIANLTAITVSSSFTAMSASDPALAEAMGVPMALVGLLVGALAGLVNGVLVGIAGITPILATLGTMQVFNGLAIAWTGGSTLYGAPSALTGLGKGTVAGLPILFVVLLVVVALIAVVVNRTPLGRKVQLQGANPVAARYSGIRPASVLISTYVITGALAGVAGLLFVARNPTASADYGSSYVLLVIVIAVLGGTNPSGGFATVVGVLLATLTLQIVQSGFSSLRLSSYEYSIAQGVILIVVLVIDQVDLRRLLRRRRRPTPKPVMQGAAQ